jgi:Sel1 repeat
MSHFAYLINSDVSSNNTTREALDRVRHISLEGARGVYPLPWICCFRASDLASHTIVSEQGSKYDLQIPITSIEKAVENLKASLPRYERLVGDTGIAHEYWQDAIEAIKGLPYRFITLNITDFIFLDPENAKAFTSGFSSQSDPLSGLDELFEYHKGVHALSLAEFNGPPPVKRKRNAEYELRNHNSCVLFCPRYIADTDPALMFERMFSQQMQNAEKGIPGCMFQVGQFYLHGRGTAKNVEEGLRWCIKAAEAGDTGSARFLSFLYGSGGLGVPNDKDKAAYWKSVVERSNGA